MNHSRDNETSRIAREMQRLAREHNLGATGKYPEGKLDDTDEGELKLAVGVQGGKVVLSFGTAVAWVGFDAKQAREIAELLRKHSYQVKP